MELQRKRKILILALAACVFFSVAFTETLAAASIDHVCIEHCYICLKIEAVEIFLTTLKIAFIGFHTAVFLLFIFQIIHKSTKLITYNLLPVTLKVRNNS
jgi:hypothetical protein